jgi:uncharacterized protein YjbI with pentapeptide repeats
MERASLRNVVLSDSSLEATILKRAKLRKATINQAVFRNAVLSRANLQGAVISESVFTDADLERAILRGAIISDAEDLTQAQLNEACCDDSTKMPAGLVPNFCPFTSESADADANL